MNLAYMKHFLALGPQVEYGPDVHEHIGQVAKSMGCHKALIVTDPNLMKAGIVDKIARPLKAEGIDVEIFAEVNTEPTDLYIHNGVDFLKQTGADLLVGLGGGSAMDCAKCIGVMSENQGHIRDYEGSDSNFPNDKKVPLITLPTTSGSGAEIAGWAVITDTSRSYKMSLGSPYLEPDYALVDPVLTIDLPRQQTAYSGFDALSQAMEGMLSRRRTPVSLALGMYAVRIISENLPKAVKYGWDVEARSNMSIGSLMAGIVINTSGCIAVHSLAETMGGIYHAPHGLMVGLILPHILKFLLPGDQELLAQFAKALGANTTGCSVYEAAHLSVSRVNQLLAELEFPTLTEIGLKEQDIANISQLALGNACTADNPCDMTGEDFEAVLGNMLTDTRSST